MSDYAYRGWSQTDERPALQGGFDYAHDSGLYAGVWGSNVSWRPDASPNVSNSPSSTLRRLQGTVGAIGYDVGLLQYYYPGSTQALQQPEHAEGYVGLSWEFLSFSTRTPSPTCSATTCPTAASTTTSAPRSMSAAVSPSPPTSVYSDIKGQDDYTD